MKISMAFKALVFAVAASSSPTSSAAADSRALAIAQRPTIASQFKAALLEAAFKTTTVQIAFATCGDEQFRAIVKEGLETAVAASQTQWDVGNATMMERLLPVGTLAASASMSDEEVHDMLASVDRGKLAAEYEGVLQPVLVVALKLALEHIFDATYETCKQGPK